MGDAHEEFLASLFEGIQNRGSGNQWANPIDGRQSRKHVEYSFAWDGKSTLGKSISIPLTMWDKARLQAGGDRPMLGLRWYANEKLEVLRDLVVLSAHDFAEVLQAANRTYTEEDMREAFDAGFVRGAWAADSDLSVEERDEDEFIAKKKAEKGFA